MIPSIMAARFREGLKDYIGHEGKQAIWALVQEE